VAAVDELIARVCPILPRKTTLSLPLISTMLASRRNSGRLVDLRDKHKIFQLRKRPIPNSPCPTYRVRYARLTGST
jgi:hypothetical protein